jgi:hypothetical protein
MFLDHTQGHTTVSRTAMDEGSARRRDLHLTTNNTHKRQPFMSPAGFEPAIPASERQKILVLDRSATGISCVDISNAKFCPDYLKLSIVLAKYHICSEVRQTITLTHLLFKQLDFHTTRLRNMEFTVKMFNSLSKVWELLIQILWNSHLFDKLFRKTRIPNCKKIFRISSLADKPKHRRTEGRTRSPHKAFIFLLHKEPEYIFHLTENAVNAKACSLLSSALVLHCTTLHCTSNLRSLERVEDTTC